MYVICKNYIFSNFDKDAEPPQNQTTLQRNHFVQTGKEVGWTKDSGGSQEIG